MPRGSARSRGFVRGVALGAVLGGAVVLIFTPRTGEEMREGIGELSRLLAERLRGALTGESGAITAPAPDAADTPTPPA